MEIISITGQTQARIVKCVGDAGARHGGAESTAKKQQHDYKKTCFFFKFPRVSLPIKGTDNLLTNNHERLVYSLSAIRVLATHTHISKEKS